MSTLRHLGRISFKGGGAFAKKGDSCLKKLKLFSMSIVQGADLKKKIKQLNNQTILFGPIGR